MPSHTSCSRRPHRANRFAAPSLCGTENRGAVHKEKSRGGHNFYEQPRDGVFSAGRLFLHVFFGFLNALSQDAEGAVGLFPVDQERRRKTKRVFARTEDAQPVVEGAVHDLIP